MTLKQKNATEWYDSKLNALKEKGGDKIFFALKKCLIQNSQIYDFITSSKANILEFIRVYKNFQQIPLKELHYKEKDEEKNDRFSVGFTEMGEIIKYTELGTDFYEHNKNPVKIGKRNFGVPMVLERKAWGFGLSEKELMDTLIEILGQENEVDVSVKKYGEKTNEIV